MTVKLSKLVDVRKVIPLNAKPRDLYDKPLILKSFEITEGDYGEFVAMFCVGKDTGELFLVSTGEKSILDILKALPPELPGDIEFSFHREGRTTLMAD